MTQRNVALGGVHHHDSRLSSAAAAAAAAGGLMLAEMTNCFPRKLILDDSATMFSVLDRSSASVKGGGSLRWDARSPATSRINQQQVRALDQRAIASSSCQGGEALAEASSSWTVAISGDRAGMELHPRVCESNSSDGEAGRAATCYRIRWDDEIPFAGPVGSGSGSGGLGAGGVEQGGHSSFSQWRDISKGWANDRLCTSSQVSNPRPPPLPSPAVCAAACSSPNHWSAFPRNCDGYVEGATTETMSMSRPSRGTSTSTSTSFSSSSSPSSPCSSACSFNSVLAQAESESYPSRRNPSPPRGGWKDGNLKNYPLCGSSAYSKPASNVRRYGGFFSSPYHASDLDGGGRIAYAGLADDYYDAAETNFMSACNFCSKRLGPNEDIFIYRGDSAFCSAECRQQVIQADQGFPDGRQDSSSAGYEEFSRRKLPFL